MRYICTSIVATLVLAGTSYAELGDLHLEVVGNNLIPSHTTYRLYAEIESGNHLTAVFGNGSGGLLIEPTNGDFYQHPYGGCASTVIHFALFEFFPELEWDSWVTIGCIDSSGSPFGRNMLQVLGIDCRDFENGGALVTSNGVWFINPGYAQGYADANGNVLIGQFTVPEASGLDAVVNLLINTPKGETIEVLGATLVWNGDSDGDGIPDSKDICPFDPDNDIDGDGVCGDVDAFPNDPNEWADSDGDGVGDNGDAFPNDPNEWADSDGDGVGDNGDAFPNDPNEWADSDGDGLGDNADGAPRGACCVVFGCVATNSLDCAGLGGTWLSEGGSCDDCPASCMGDTDGNGVVNIEDLLNMLGSWGACP